MTLNSLCLRTLCWTTALTGAFILSGCRSQTDDEAAKAQAEQIEKLRQDNADLAQVQADNETVQKLRKENEELPKLRSQYQEANRLRKENDLLRQQLAKLKPAGGAAGAQAASIASASANEQADAKKKGPYDDLTLNEGDELMVEPRFLKQLLPDFDWEKLGRKEPLAVRALLEKDGVQLTNALQLHEYGITNFVIRRAPVQADGTPVPPQ